MEKRQKPSLHKDWIDPKAVEIVRRLQERGYQTYLVGGCVRDLLSGIHPKDYDIATSARPEEVRKIIKGSYIIGRRFQLVLVKRGDQQFEVATFRRNALPEEHQSLISESPFPFSPDNFFGTPEEDAQRRDFTLNALFYDPIKCELLDYVEGLKDIEAGLVRMIGQPKVRIIEDPIRMLRAIRISHKLGFSLEPDLRQSIFEMAEEIRKSVLPRKREEYLKFLKLPDPSLAFLEMMDLNLLQHTLPSLQKIWQNPLALDQAYVYLSRSPEFIGGDNKPIHIILPLFLSLMSLVKTPEGQTLSQAGDDEIDPEIEKQLASIEAILREEMGVFRGEQSMLSFGYRLQEALMNVDRFMKRGHRRQKAFLSQEELPLALHIAELDYQLPADRILYWESRLNRNYQADDYQSSVRD